MVQPVKFAVSLIITFALVSAQASPIATGWHKVLVSGKHSGYLLQEYSFDKTSKQFTATSFMRIMLPNQDISRSLKAVASEKLHPISYQFTEQVGQKIKLIDANFQQGVMTLNVTENGKAKSGQLKLQKGTFLGIFLYLLMITNKKGIKKGTHFAYSAIAEESGKVHTGATDVIDIIDVDGLETFKILNNFAGARTIEHVTPTGQIVRTKDPFSGVESRLVSTQAEATGGAFPVPTKSISVLFGQIPGPSFPGPKGKALGGPKDNLGLPPGVAPPPGKGK